MIHKISRKELLQAQAALLTAIILQVITRHIGGELLPGTQTFLIIIECALAGLIGFTVNVRHIRAVRLHHVAAVVLLALISAANISALVFVLDQLIVTHASANGEQLLASAVAIFITNIIVFALWYWEIDSPGLTRTRWSRSDKDFQFTQQDMVSEFPQWRPEFVDYVYLSITNAVNFAPADTRPLTRQAKALMAAQSLVSVFTLALVIARSVSILGN
ncbi:MAG TPA: hypothetical protein VF401_04470 [Candidatus Saccharimonadales bacterium]